MSKYKFAFIILLILLINTLFSEESNITGKKVPSFTLETHDEKKVTNKTFLGKYYAFIFEGSDGNNKNLHVRKRILSFIKMLPAKKRKKIIFFAVADVSSYLSLIRPIIRSKIRQNEIKEKIRIYCDFSGDIRNKFNLIKNETNFVLIDSKGIVKFAIRGVVSEKKLNKISKYLINIFKAPYTQAPIDISPAYQ